MLLPLDCVFLSSLSRISLGSGVSDRCPCGSLLAALPAVLSLDFSAEYACLDWTLLWTD